jgi:hypothetical protein
MSNRYSDPSQQAFYATDPMEINFNRCVEDMTLDFDRLPDADYYSDLLWAECANFDSLSILRSQAQYIVRNIDTESEPDKIARFCYEEGCILGLAAAKKILGRTFDSELSITLEHIFDSVQIQTTDTAQYAQALLDLGRTYYETGFTPKDVQPTDYEDGDESSFADLIDSFTDEQYQDPKHTSYFTSGFGLVILAINHVCDRRDHEFNQLIPVLRTPSSPQD